MRLISNDGKVDVHYSYSGLYVKGNSVVSFPLANINPHQFIMGTYTDSNRAMGVIKNIRDAYNRNEEYYLFPDR